MDLNLTTRSQEAVSSAVRRAASSGNPHVEPLHLLLALLEQPDGIAAALLDALGADRAALFSQTKSAVDRLPEIGSAHV